MLNVLALQAQKDSQNLKVFYLDFGQMVSLSGYISPYKWLSLSVLMVAS